MGVLVSDAPDDGLGRALHHERAASARRDRVARRPSSTRPARGGRQLRQLERRRRPARPRHRAWRCRPPRPRRSGVEPAQVGVASTGVIGIELPREHACSAACAPPCAALGDDAADFSEAILTTDNGPKRACLEVALPAAARVRLAAQAKGAGDDPAPLRDDVLLRARPTPSWSPRRSICSPACASSARSTASRSTASSPPATPCSRSPTAPPACGWSPRAADELRLGEALDALMRQLALEIVADGEGARARRADRGRGPPRRRRAGGALDRQLAAGEDRAARRRPQLRPHPAGGGPGAGRPGDPFVADLEIEGRQLVSAGDAIGARRRETCASSSSWSPATRSSTC